MQLQIERQDLLLHSHCFFSLFPPPFKISNLLKIAQWSQSFYTETLSCQLSIAGDESEDKKVCVRLAVQARTEGEIQSARVSIYTRRGS